MGKSFIDQPDRTFDIWGFPRLYTPLQPSPLRWNKCCGLCCVFPFLRVQARHVTPTRTRTQTNCSPSRRTRWRARRGELIVLIAAVLSRRAQQSHVVRLDTSKGVLFQCSAKVNEFTGTNLNRAANALYIYFRAQARASAHTQAWFGPLTFAHTLPYLDTASAYAERRNKG